MSRAKKIAAATQRAPERKFFITDRYGDRGVVCRVHPDTPKSSKRRVMPQYLRRRNNMSLTAKLAFGGKDHDVVAVPNPYGAMIRKSRLMS